MKLELLETRQLLASENSTTETSEATVESCMSCVCNCTHVAATQAEQSGSSSSSEPSTWDKVWDHSGRYLVDGAEVVGDKLDGMSTPELLILLANAAGAAFGTGYYFANKQGPIGLRALGISTVLSFVAASVSTNILHLAYDEPFGKTAIDIFAGQAIGAGLAVISYLPGIKFVRHKATFGGLYGVGGVAHVIVVTAHKIYIFTGGQEPYKEPDWARPDDQIAREGRYGWFTASDTE